MRSQRLTTPINVTATHQEGDHPQSWRFVYFAPSTRTYYTENYDAAMSEALYLALQRGEMAWLSLVSDAHAD